MFPAKAHGPTVFDFNSVGVDAACCHQAREGLPLFMGMPLVTPDPKSQSHPLVAHSNFRHKKSTPISRKCLIYLVELSGIEPLTSTLPVLLA